MKVVSLWLFTLFLIGACKAEAPDVNFASRCNKKLMNTFQLKGFEHPMVKVKPDICPNVKENCCTLTDQLSINKLWNDFTLPQINFQVSQTVILYQRLFNLKNYVMLLEMTMIPFHYVKPKWIPYEKTYCNFQGGQGDVYRFNYYDQINELV